MTAKEGNCPFGIISTIPFMLFVTRTRTPLPPSARPLTSGSAPGLRRSSYRACSPTQPSGRCSTPCPGSPNGWPGPRGSARPAEFARYLEELAGAYQDCRESRPALPYGGLRAPRDQPATRARLWLVTAAGTAIAAGLGLLGITAPDRL